MDRPEPDQRASELEAEVTGSRTMEVTIVTKQTVDVGEDPEAPVQEAESILIEMLHELKEEGEITDYSIVGPVRPHEEAY